jgi:PPM family protein phosphatase
VRKMADVEDETKEQRGASFADNFFAKDESGFSVEIVAATHVGKVRQRNEDHFAVIRRTRRCELLLSNLQEDAVNLVDGHAYGLLVADGVGGARHGDFASHLVLEATLHAADQASSWVMKFKDFNAQEMRQRVDAYVSKIQDEFHRHAKIDPDKSQMGTTLTGAYLLPPHAIISHIGDSRAYIQRQGKLKQVTRDHTLAQSLVDRGTAPQDAKAFANVLVNSIDAVRDHIEADVVHLEMETRDRLLLCSDGLSDMVPEEQICDILKSEGLKECCDGLVKAALENGGRDNITVVLCELTEE